MEQQKNPFSRSRKERKLINPGIYPSTLTSVRVVQVMDKKTSEKKDKLVFSFYIPAKDTEIPAFFTPSTADNSYLVKFLKTMHGDAFTPAIQNDPDAMWKFVQTMQGQDFSLVVTQSNGWNNIASAMKVVQPKEELTDDDLFAFTDSQETVNI